MTGYLRSPAIHGDDVVFVYDDDLWHVHADGARAYRLTSGVSEVRGPRLSPDGRHIVFVGAAEGAFDVYVMAAAGGPPRRLTFQGGETLIAGFDPSGDLIYASDAGQAHRVDRWLHRVPLEGGAPEALSIGPATVIEHAASGAVVLGRIVRDPARWKRYRGGQVGDLWIDLDGSGEFGRLIRVDGNVASPCVIGERVFFLSDHEGIGNVYSCTFHGGDLRRHTHHEDFYARGMSGDGRRLVYHCGAELYLLDPAEATSRRIEVTMPGAASQRDRQFVPATDNLDTVAISPDGTHLTLCTRGKAYAMGHFAGPVRQLGEPDGVRYRFLSQLAGKPAGASAASVGAEAPAVSPAGPAVAPEALAVEAEPAAGPRFVATVADESEHERFAIIDDSGSTVFALTAAGYVAEMLASPVEDLVAFSNNRNELFLLDLRGDEPTAHLVDSSSFARFEDLAWSADGRWLAYTAPVAVNRTGIKLLRVADRTTHVATSPIVRDRRPAFDPLGRYLYFIGQRDFDPVYDELQFDLNFPLASRPYVITLRDTELAPFLGAISAPGGKPAEKDDKADNAAPPVVEIDLAGIERRVVPLPVPQGRYERIAGTAEKVLYTSHPVVGVAGRGFFGPGADTRTLHACTLATGKCEDLITQIADFQLSPDHRTLLYRVSDRLRVLGAGEKASDATEPGAESGWVDLDRVKVSVWPGAEWRQMFREAWRLQRENFWDPEMSGIDWVEVYDRYLPLVDKVATRAELSDLFWELQGELGTSHAYELGGSYRHSPNYRQGFLGVDWSVDADGTHRVARVLDGDVWSPEASSPLARPGLNVTPGTAVVAVNGVAVTRDRPVSALLVNQAEQEVALTVRGGDGRARTLRVRTVASETPIRYREWVNANRALVHERSSGRLGYLHIPDMSAVGFAEFHRGFLAEFGREGLVIDVRYNGGGHVSSLLLNKLARKRIAYSVPRWGQPSPYPDESPRGALVMVTNEHAGSDGDIVSHGFKQMGLGPLIGRRTWGGVIGIWARHLLADGTLTTQPEDAFAFDNVGWGVENYGTDPDIEVDYRPQDYAKGFDPQLDRSIDEALAALSRTPAHTRVELPRKRFVRPRLGDIPVTEVSS